MLHFQDNVSYDLIQIKHIETLFMLSKVSDLKIVTTALTTLAETFIIIAPL